jgi:hypothetical protein
MTANQACFMLSSQMVHYSCICLAAVRSSLPSLDVRYVRDELLFVFSFRRLPTQTVQENNIVNSGTQQPNLVNLKTVFAYKAI